MGGQMGMIKKRDGVWVACHLIEEKGAPQKMGGVGRGKGREQDGTWMECCLINKKNLSPQQWGGKLNMTRWHVGSTLPRHCHSLPFNPFPHSYVPFPLSYNPPNSLLLS